MLSEELLAQQTNLTVLADLRSLESSVMMKETQKISGVQKVEQKEEEEVEMNKVF